MPPPRTFHPPRQIQPNQHPTPLQDQPHLWIRRPQALPAVLVLASFALPERPNPFTCPTAQKSRGLCPMCREPQNPDLKPPNLSDISPTNQEHKIQGWLRGLGIKVRDAPHSSAHAGGLCAGIARDTAVFVRGGRYWISINLEFEVVERESTCGRPTIWSSSLFPCGHVRCSDWWAIR